MVKNRKPAQKLSAASKVPSEGPLIDIPEADQWRIIKESGVLNMVPNAPQAQTEEQLSETPLAEEIFSAVTLIIPHAFLLLMMEILVHYQYGRRPTNAALVERMISGVPFLSIFIFYTSRYKQTRWVQGLLFLLSIAAGPRLIYMINHANWLANMKQCPPLATAWVYAIVQLNLLPATLSLIIVAVWARYTNMKILF